MSPFPDSLELDENRLPDDSEASLASLFFDEDEAADQTADERADTQEFIRWFSDLEKDDFIGAMIVLLMVRRPGISYAAISRYLTERFGTVHGITGDVVRHRIGSLHKSYGGLAAFLGKKRKSVRAAKRRRVSYGNGSDH